MVCVSPVEINGQLDYPCGQCLACKMQRSNEWAARLMHESLYWKEPMFLTLTYNEENLPKGNTLVPEHLVNFLKRVNARLKYQGRKFKYFATGEYGSAEYTERPHYHIVAFGLELTDFEEIEGLRKVKYRIAQWKKGFVDVKPLIYHRARYTAKYILKNQYVYKKSDIEKMLKNGEKYPCFRRSSQGLGLRWAMDHKKDLEKGYIIVGKCKRSIPRYYVKKLELELPEITDLYKEREKREYEEYINAYNSKQFKNEFDEMKWLDEYALKRMVQIRKNKESEINFKQSILYSLRPRRVESLDS